MRACARRAYSQDVAKVGASWDAIKTDALSDASKRELMALQKAVADMRDAVNRVAYKGPEPDFAAMKKDTKMPEIVDVFEKAYKSVTTPSVASPEIEELKTSFAGIEAEARADAEVAKKRIAELDVELKAIADQRSKLATMTMDEYFEANPEMKKDIDQRIANDEWFQVK